MKFVCSADWHTRLEAPKYRKDNYFQTMLEKIRWIVKFTNDENAILLIAGDIFDSPKLGYAVTNAVSEELKKLDIAPVACFGNHDTTFHSQDLSNTPYGNLLVHKVIREGLNLDGVQIHSLGWEAKEPTPTKGKLNILLGHVSVFEDDVPFWCENGMTAKQAGRRYPGFDWYVFGDIHIPFYKGKVINPGSLTRSAISQVEYSPRIYLLNTNNEAVESVDIPIQPAEEVFDLDQKEMDAVRDVKALNSFIDTIKYSGEKPSFRVVLDDVVKQADVSDEVVEILNEVLEVN